MRRRATWALLVGLLLAVVATPPAAVPAATPNATPTSTTTVVERVGTSTGGRAIRVVRRCAPEPSTDVLVIGVIHGNETAGASVVRRLTHVDPPARTCLWLVASINPDGQARGTRQNARGVDLNRNFSTTWRGGGRPFDTYFPGRAAASEPETRAVQRLVRRIRPDATVWYHQHLTMVIRPPGAWRIAMARVYERVSRLGMRGYPGGRLHGTASSWQHASQPRSLALVVELPAGRLSRIAVARHAAAVRALAVATRHDRVVAARHHNVRARTDVRHRAR